jgi:septum formation protein
VIQNQRAVNAVIDAVGRKLILASASPRRQELLSSVGVPFQIVVAKIEEEALFGETAESMCRRLSQLKAKAVFERCAGGVILAADTTVCLPNDGSEGGEVILGKPSCPVDAMRMLRLLSGRMHQVWTAFSILGSGIKGVVTRSVITRVFFRELSELEIEEYVRSGEPLDKAGAYGAQGIGAFAIERVEGSYTNVIGLPLSEVLVELTKLGLWGPEMLRNCITLES